MSVYFAFKPLRLSNFGGIMPYGVHVLTCHGDWYVGKIEDAKQLYLLKDFLVVPIDEETARGFHFLDVDKVPVDPSDENSDLRPLTEDELEAKKQAQKFLKKMEVRSYIELNNGDVLDLIADLSKTVAYLTKLLYDKGIIDETTYSIFANYLSLYDLETLPKKLQSRNDYIASILTKYFKEE